MPEIAQGLLDAPGRGLAAPWKRF